MIDLFDNLPPDIRLLFLQADPQLERNAVRILSADERARLNSISHASRRRGFLLGRMAMRTLLSNLSDRDPVDIPLLIEPSGKPVSPGSGVHISLAHSDDRALAVAAPHLVGIDLERTREKPPTLLEYILHPDERKHIHGLDMGPLRTLFICWTLKEAVLKATGSGLRTAPRTVRLFIQPENGRAAIHPPDGSRWEGRFVEHDGYVGAVAFEDGAQRAGAKPERPTRVPRTDQGL